MVEWKEKGKGKGKGKDEVQNQTKGKMRSSVGEWLGGRTWGGKRIGRDVGFMLD